MSLEKPVKKAVNRLLERSMISVFIGFDERQRVSFTTLASSIYELSSAPVSVSPLVLRTLPISRRGLTPFTFSRFLVPWFKLAV